jgi:hypothetical protein
MICQKKKPFALHCGVYLKPALVASRTTQRESNDSPYYRLKYDNPRRGGKKVQSSRMPNDFTPFSHAVEGEDLIQYLYKWTCGT